MVVIVLPVMKLSFFPEEAVNAKSNTHKINYLAVLAKHHYTRIYRLSSIRRHQVLCSLPINRYSSHQLFMYLPTYIQTPWMYIFLFGTLAHRLHREMAYS